MAKSSRKDGSSFPISEERFQRKVISLLAEIRMEIRDLKQKMESDSSLAEEGGIPLQTTTIEELEVLENSLSSSDERKRLIRVLSRVGGSNVGECARRILMKLMTYDVMAGFSLKGRKRKRSFQNLRLFQVTVDAIVKTVKCTEVAAGAAISAALKYAPDRRGGGGRGAN
ncbi:uncharacterized protein LOC117341227 [Pecten maximus]|uniref:uncharacterized protein LOC117341227 n=1 Tax=Pecten maximus TaxID=6579 RepID=UPI0014581577|nr:uncharacterized protein LOC117341227 [Pecten maximus]